MYSKPRFILAAVILIASISTISTSRADDFVVDDNTYAAIAYSQATGRYGYAYDYRSRKSAEQAAVRNCKADDAKAVCWVNAGWCALALGDDQKCYGTGYTYGNGATHSEASRQAVFDCQKRTTGAHVAVFLLSDGQLVFTVNSDESNTKQVEESVKADPVPSSGSPQSK